MYVSSALLLKVWNSENVSGDLSLLFRQASSATAFLLKASASSQKTLVLVGVNDS